MIAPNRQPANLTSEQAKACLNARAMGKHAEVPPMPISRVSKIFDEEAEQVIKRAFTRAEQGKIHYGVAATVRKALRQVQAILWALDDLEREKK